MSGAGCASADGEATGAWSFELSVVAGATGSDARPSVEEALIEPPSSVGMVEEAAVACVELAEASAGGSFVTGWVAAGICWDWLSGTTSVDVKVLGFATATAVQSSVTSWDTGLLNRISNPAEDWLTTKYCNPCANIPSNVLVGVVGSANEIVALTIGCAA